MTPVRRQYLQLKQSYPGALLFFRMGDFYEAFDEDAEIISRELNIVLTARDAGKGNKVPMAGVPHHAAENYIARLIKAGYKVAVCEQVGQEAVNGLMPREVVRVVTPGTVVEPTLLDAKEHNYLLAFVIHKNRAGLAYVDITTGEFAATLLQSENVERLVANEITRLQPAEILLSDDQDMPTLNRSYHLTRFEAWRFEINKSKQVLQDHFEIATLAGFGLQDKTLVVRAAGGILQYLEQSQKATLAQITGLSYYDTSNFMILDSNTRRNLELTQTLQGQGGRGSMIDVLDQTLTPMGGRLLRNWIRQPLLDVVALNKRLDAVEFFFQSTAIRAEIGATLSGVSDLERLTSRTLQGIARPKDLVDLRRSLTCVPAIRASLEAQDQAQLAALIQALDPCEHVVRLLGQAIVDEPPAQLNKGNVIRPGFSQELDQVIDGARHAREWIANLEQVERDRTGVKTLKVGFNKVFGYYLEVTKTNVDQVPLEYIRKQTLVNSERYITPELKEYETLILNAEERQSDIESRIYKEVLAQVAAYHKNLYETASALAHLDVYLALGQVAAQKNYIRPSLDEDDVIDIVDGRHPVVEETVLETQVSTFVPNDTYLSAKDLVWIITGPNMAGKSTFLRQVALIVLMAQIGSFVPARKAHIGLVDRIFTRIGAQDEIHSGQSTFMVEMVETAALLAQSTSKSLLILDEIGRGTSTYDGLAIARAIIEYIHNSPSMQAKTLFATHYHELVEMEKYLPHVKNYNIAVADEDKDVIFLHKVIPGGADRSYGVHVAQLAGIPKAVITRANEILAELEQNTGLQEHKQQLRQAFSGQQLSFFAPDVHPLVDDLKTLNVEELSPLEALNKLFEMKRKVQDD